MSFHHRLNTETIRLITHSSIHNLLVGAGICYTIKNEKIYTYPTCNFILDIIPIKIKIKY